MCETFLSFSSIRTFRSEQNLIVLVYMGVGCVVVGVIRVKGKSIPTTHLWRRRGRGGIAPTHSRPQH
jgi:hypothetical protein